MNSSTIIDRFRSYGSLLRVVVRHGRGEVFDTTSWGPDSSDDDGEAEALARDLESLGPAYVKLGQLLSTRADLLSPAYLHALERLQEKCEPFPTSEARRIIEEELGLEVGDVFRNFSDEPIGSASFSQVHTARLRDGRRVAVKIQRPDLRERVRKELDALATLAELVDRHSDLGAQIGFTSILSELRYVLEREMDYRQEARNLETLRENLAHRELIVVPRPVNALSTSRVLTMDRIDGMKVTDLGTLGILEIDGKRLARELFEAYLDQALVDGFLHADPHPGNVLLTQTGKLALIDLGMVTTVPETQRETLLQLLLAVAENRGPDVSRLSQDLGDRLPDFDEPAYQREITDLVQRVRGATVDEIDVGGVLFELTRIGAGHGLRPAPELALLAKTLLNIDAVAIALNPHFDPQEALREHAAVLLGNHSKALFDPGRLLGVMLDLQRVVRRLPANLRSISDAFGNGEVRIRVDAIDEERLIQGLHKIANRIAVGVVLAALILGAALLMRVQAGPQLFGYPALALIFFVLAACCGFGLVGSVLLTDFRDHRK